MNAPLPNEADLVVIGAGAAGMTAALAGALQGLDVVLCEATQQVGGTTATSAGTIWIPGNTPSREAGYQDNVEEAMRYLDGLVPSGEGRQLREAYFRNGPAIIDEIMKRSQVKFTAAGPHPDYIDIAGSKAAGRAMASVPYDGRLLGKDFERVRAPMKEFMVLGGMMVGKLDIGHLVGRYKSWTSFRHTVSLMLRHASDRLIHSRGTRLVMGNALVAGLYASLRDNRVKIAFGAPLQELLLQDGRVRGVRVKREDGSMADIGARRGVILSTGGIGHHPELRRQFMRPGQDKWPSLAFEANTGGGVAAARQSGAAMTASPGKAGVLYQPVSITRDRNGPTGLFPHIFLDRAKPGFIAVDSMGLRFTNEGNSYHYFSEDMARRHATTPAVPCWAICDAEFVRKYGLGLVYPGTTNFKAHVESGYMVCADTIEELARKTGIDAKGLAATIARNNEFARAGTDADFGKGSTEVSRFNGDPEHKPNPCIGPIARAPFCAMQLWPADAAADAGLATDEHARVLREDGSPIEGLYACGGDMASIMRGSYPAPGATIGPAMVFGWRAAMHAAGRAQP
ncbi:3-oxosteroid 1-dehydrogenase [Variovorax sp. PBS-H4]|uniref:FAD-dependent oxidoreductase n=1 Tax=Variovorax sp. PBS-H4 TaxID=434008 RepID=UPI001316D343|nr:FAD-dependent oxidoreductase [Variovorax sp. PBS-H4]VTU36465.1 3-oxosteroid 1-dehydrogenase [Variovorax sp. PBS-H4]